MNNQRDWKRNEAVVRKVIHEWDPYHLLESGAPADEWDREILQIARLVGTFTSPSQAAEVGSDVFSRAFQPEGFSEEDCADVGRKLYHALKKR